MCCRVQAADQRVGGTGIRFKRTISFD